MLRHLLLALPLLLAACAVPQADAPTLTATAPAAPVSDQDQRAMQIVADMDKISALLDRVTDEASANAALPALRAINDHMDQIAAAQARETFVAREYDPAFLKLAAEIDRAGSRLEDSTDALKQRSPKAFTVITEGLKNRGGDSAQKCSADMLAQFAQIEKIYVSVTDEASAKAALPKLNDTFDAIITINARMKKLPDPPADVLASFHKAMHESDLRIDAQASRLYKQNQAALVILTQATMRLEKNPPPHAWLLDVDKPATQPK